MLKLAGSLSASFHPTGYEHTYSDTLSTNPVARRIGNGCRLFKKSAARIAPIFAAGQTPCNPRNSPENDESNFKLSISNWNWMASKSLNALHEGAMAEVQHSASLFTRDQHLSELSATDFWQDLPDAELPGGPVRIEPFAFARRSLHAGRAA